LLSSLKFMIVWHLIRVLFLWFDLSYDRSIRVVYKVQFKLCLLCQAVCLVRKAADMPEKYPLILITE